MENMHRHDMKTAGEGGDALPGSVPSAYSNHCEPSGPPRRFGLF
jgi:hypothetical protein